MKNQEAILRESPAKRPGDSHQIWIGIILGTCIAALFLFQLPGAELTPGQKQDPPSERPPWWWMIH
ncbi:hypothetical protein TDB9533_03749 [Thalassocella blandensis]|nr:hypothetical protein TDB9533_03749 [Thalassocella blandensis]